MAATHGLACGEWLQRYRLAAGLSQEALAERTGLSAHTINTLERGVKQRPYKDTVALLWVLPPGIGGGRAPHSRRALAQRLQAGQ